MKQAGTRSMLLPDQAPFAPICLNTVHACTSPLRRSRAHHANPLVPGKRVRVAVRVSSPSVLHNLYHVIIVVVVVSVVKLTSAQDDQA